MEYFHNRDFRKYELFQKRIIFMTDGIQRFRDDSSDVPKALRPYKYLGKRQHMACLFFNFRNELLTVNIQLPGRMSRINSN